MAKWEGNRAFRAWLEGELAARDWKPIDLARRMNPEAPANVASSISRWMLGKRQPDTASCATLAEILGVDLDTVLALAGHRPADRSGDELINSIAASLQNLPREQVEMINTTVRALHDEQVRKRAAAKGEGEGKLKQGIGKASKASNTAMAMAPIEVLIAAQHVAPVARRMALLIMLAFGVVIDLEM